MSLDYIVGLSPERNPGTGALVSSFATLAGLAGEAAPTASDVVAVVDAAILYQCSGAPCGEQPLNAWRGFMQHLAGCLTAAAKGDSAQLIDSANAATVAALEVAKMPGLFLTKKKEGT